MRFTVPTHRLSEANWVVRSITTMFRVISVWGHMKSISSRTRSVAYLVLSVAPIFTASVAMVCCASVFAQEAPTQNEVGKTIDVGKTGFAIKRPVFASACPHGCPWGELGEFVQEALKPYGYDVVLCRNCNRAEGP